MLVYSTLCYPIVPRFPQGFPNWFPMIPWKSTIFSAISTIHSLILSIIPKPFLYIAMISPGFYDFPSYPLVNVYITMEKHNFQWVNPLFLWPFSSSQTVNVYHYFYGHFQVRKLWMFTTISMAIFNSKLWMFTTISMAIFNSYVSLPEGIWQVLLHICPDFPQVPGVGPGYCTAGLCIPSMLDPGVLSGWPWLTPKKHGVWPWKSGKPMGNPWETHGKPWNIKSFGADFGDFLWLIMIHCDSWMLILIGRHSGRYGKL